MSSGFERALRALDGLLPEALREGSADRRNRARALVGTCLWIVVVALSLVVLNVALHEALGALMAAGSAALTVLALALLRLTRRLRVTTVVSGLAAFGLISVSAYNLGGWRAQPLNWLAVLPLLGLLIGGRRVGVVLAGLGVAGYTAFYLALVYRVPMGASAGADLVPAQYVDRLLLTASVLALALVYETFKRRAMAELKATTERLTAEVEEHRRTRDRLDRAQEELVRGARLAGMAEIATGVLHNVGNGLNHVMTSTGLIAERLEGLRLARLSQTVDLLREHQADLPWFLSADPKGRLVPQYLAAGLQSLTEDHRALLAELGVLRQGLEHVAKVVATQQRHAHYVDREERVDLARTVDDVLALERDTFRALGIRLEPQLAPVPPVRVRKHKLLQILLNLLSNAREAIKAQRREGGVVRLALAEVPAGRLRLEVVDNGVGIAAEHLGRIFQYGFTTRADGHGFGLHSSAIAATELGGALRCHSEGPGLGARFELELPLVPDREVD